MTDQRNEAEREAKQCAIEFGVPFAVLLSVNDGYDVVMGRHIRRSDVVLCIFDSTGQRT